MFVAYVEVDGVYYVDEEVTLIGPGSDRATPAATEDACG